MKRKKMPKSLRKHIRLEKARIRREVLGLEEQKRQINELYKKFTITKIKKLNEGQKVQENN